MKRPSRASIIAVVLVAATSIAVGWAATSFVQQHVPLGRGFSACWKLAGTARQTECLSDEFVAGAAEAGAGARGARRQLAVIGYVQQVERAAAHDERLAALCHAAMHELGQREGRSAARTADDLQWPDASKKFCTAGFVHGLAEGYLAEAPPTQVATSFAKLCNDPSAKTGCAHGVGHSLVQRSESDDDGATPESIADDTTRRCAELPDGFGAHCDNGVFMELAMRHDDARLTPDQYVKLCRDRHQVEQQLACMNYLAMNLSANDVSTEQTPVWCARSGGALEGRCIESWGRELGLQRVHSCEQVRTDALIIRCIDAAVALQIGSDHVTPEAGRRMCQSLSTAPRRSICRDAIMRYRQASDDAAPDAVSDAPPAAPTRAAQRA